MRRHSLLTLVVLLLAGTACGETTSPPIAAPAPPAAVVPSPLWSPAAPSPLPPAPSLSALPTKSSTPAPDGILRRGDSGPAVLAWQERLSALGYWLGTPDGRFGTLTQQATYALEKAAGLSRLGTVRAATRRAAAAGIRPRARSSSGHVVEIDLARQLLTVVDDGRVRVVFNTSTGSGDAYLSEGRRRLAVTPRGYFRVYAEIDGLRESPLGLLWRPKYFRGGVAIHGAPSVPPWPASHGCVRLSYPAMDWLWAHGQLPIGTAVWVR